MKLSVNTSIPISFEKVEDIHDGRFTKVKIYLMHTGKNLNNSFFSKEVVEKAIPSLSNIPILGFIEVDNYNQSDFKGHEQRLVIDNDGVKIEYLGRAYGMIPETNDAHFEKMIGEDGVEREYLVVNGLLWNKFQEAIDIFDRDGSKPQSMELFPDSIKGEFKNGVFHFSEFKFEGACILGSSVQPAMVSSLIEKVDFSLGNNHFSEMLSEFNQYYSSLNQSKETDLNIDNQEGGKGVDQLLELFAQYPSLTEEDVAEIKANLEQYTVDTLKTKLDELLAEKEKSNEPEEKFSTASQLEQELRYALSQAKTIDRWGDEVRAYWYIDHDENRVYAESVEIGYLPVGMNYTKKGDFVEIDFSSRKRVKFVPQDMEEGSEAPSSFVSLERNEFEIEKTKEKTQKEVSDQFAEVQKELDEIKPQFEELQRKNQELQSQIDSFSADQFSEENKQLKEQIDELSAYKQAREKQDKLDVIKKFTQLTDEEKQPLIDEIDKYTVDELEEKLFALIGKKGISSFSTQKPNHLIVGLSGIQKSNKSDQPEWVALVEQYKLSKQQ